MCKIKYRCTFWKDSCGVKNRIIGEKKAAKCRAKGCRNLRSFILKGGSK